MSIDLNAPGLKIVTDYVAAKQLERLTPARFTQSIIYPLNIRSMKSVVAFPGFDDLLYKLL